MLALTYFCKKERENIFFQMILNSLGVNRIDNAMISKTILFYILFNLHMRVFFFIDFREKVRGREVLVSQETSIGCEPYMPQLETEPTTQTCALTSNWTHDPSVHGMMIRPTESHWLGQNCFIFNLEIDSLLFYDFKELSYVYTHIPIAKHPRDNIKLLTLSFMKVLLYCTLEH